MLQKIAEGTYGDIYKDDKYVYKISKSKEIDCSMIRETYFLSYLEESPYVIRQYGCIPMDFQEITDKNDVIEKVQGLILEKMDCNLKDFSFIIYNKYKNNPEILIKVYKRIFETLLLGLYDIQKMGILHNDLKLINVLVRFNLESPCDSFELKYCDFGLAVQTSVFGLDDVICIGTCKYSAPEMKHKSVAKFYKKNSEYKQNIMMDCYSIGVIMVHILCIFSGRKQFEKVTQDTFLDLLNSKYEVPFQNNTLIFLEKSGVDVLYSLLHEDPEKRWNPRLSLKSNYFSNRIPKFAYIEHMIRLIEKYKQTLDWKEFERFEDKMEQIDMHELPTEVYLNVFHCMMQLKKNMDDCVEQLSYSHIFKISLYWTLSIYHHKESQRYRRSIVSKSEKSKYKKIEYFYRNYLTKIRFIPFMSIFKTSEIKSDSHRKKIIEYIFSTTQ